jgi:hypothetical protein
MASVMVPLSALRQYARRGSSRTDGRSWSVEVFAWVVSTVVQGEHWSGSMPRCGGAARVSAGFGTGATLNRRRRGVRSPLERLSSGRAAGMCRLPRGTKRPADADVVQLLTAVRLPATVDASTGISQEDAAEK